MGDWNTLHLFDFNKFKLEVIPQLSNVDYLKEITNSQIFKYHRRFPTKEDLLKVVDFVGQLDTNFRKHPNMYSKDIYTRKENESHYKRDLRVNDHEHNYQLKFIDEIDLLSIIIQVKCFENCAFYNPHFKLGRRIFTGAIKCKPNSIAEEICYKVMEQELMFYNDNLNQIINWIRNEELELLFLDKNNIQAEIADCENYIKGFKTFVDIAYENKLGFISLSNFREELIKMIPNNRSLTMDLKLIRTAQGIIQG